MTQEKKFYSPVVKTYNNDLRKRWRIEWYEPLGKGPASKRIVRYLSFHKNDSIENRLNEAERILDLIKLGPQQPAKKDILQKALDFNSISYRKSTLRAYSTTLKHYKNFLNGRKPENATKETINDYVAQLHHEKSSAKKVVKYIEHLHTVYQRAEILGLIAKNPVVKLNLKTTAPLSLKFFDDSQIILFKNTEIDKQLWLAIQFLYYCFIRPRELRSLKIDNINFERGFIEIPGSISKNNKTQKVTMPNSFLSEISYLKNYSKDFYILGKNNEPGFDQISENRLNLDHSRLLKKLGITGRYAFYSWKHTGVVKAVKAGINLKDLQLQLRHHSLDMVNEYLKNLGVLDSDDLRNRYPTL